MGLGGGAWEAGLMDGWSAVPSTESPKIYVLEIDLVRPKKSVEKGEVIF